MADSMSSQHPHQVHSAAEPGGVWRLAPSWPPRCRSTYQDLRHLHAPPARTSGSYNHSNQAASATQSTRGNHRRRVVHLHRVIYNLPSPAGTERRLRHVPTPARRDRGLSEELILKNLRTRSCRAEVGDEEEHGICVVCQDDTRQGNHAIRVLDCGHDYHACCITRWLREKNICPLCKAIALHVDDDRCGLLV
ncbi:UNVERIFIED_CONTAM: putative E3 ubiquitin-protein ligase RHG1A [Sesamum radiatum]|uniref:RING-type E3 ubiquitin transferase n=1 Tax=Sesamum radiatum TaxID=300843 RepID=A0AAW2WJY9_SESRA